MADQFVLLFITADAKISLPAWQVAKIMGVPQTNAQMEQTQGTDY